MRVYGMVAGIAMLALAGCSSKHIGAPVVSSGSGKLIDPSWLTALNACWPDLVKQGYTADQLRRNLADVSSFHYAFPVYAAQGKDSLDDILGKPLQTAPFPDTSKLLHVNAPILNRGQAAAGAGQGAAVVQSTNGIAPPDALCAIQPGVPQGFSK